MVHVFCEAWSNTNNYTPVIAQVSGSWHCSQQPKTAASGVLRLNKLPTGWRQRKPSRRVYSSCHVTLNDLANSRTYTR